MIGTVWESLKATPGQGEGILERRVIPDAKVAVYAAVMKPKNIPMLRIIAPTQALPAAFSVPEASGFATSIKAQEPGPQGTACVELQLLEPAGEIVFLALVDDVLSRIESADTARRAMSELAIALSRWHGFFRTHGFRGLSRQAQQGLFGELFFLREMLAPISSTATALQAWTGPAGANQDFEYANHAFEVKTTSANPLAEVRISNLRQLDAACVESLHLVVVEVECHENADGTLVEAVEATRRLVLDTAPHLAFDLADKLAEYGYLDQHSSHYSTTGYGVRAVNAFEVREGFPCLTEDDVPSGVGEVKYSIALSAIGDFELSGEGFAELVEGWFRELGV